MTFRISAPKKINPQDKELGDQFIETLPCFLATLGLTPSAALQIKLREVFEDHINLAQLFKMSLNHKHIRGKTFASVSLGGPLNRGVAAFSRKDAGVKIINFDHGAGSGIFNVPFRRILDLLLADEFVTFSESQLSGINETLSNSLISKPKLSASKNQLFQPPVPKHSVNIGKTSNRPIIMYAPSHLSRERVYEPSLLHDLSQLRFACRLLTLLKSQNFEIKIKPHPGCKTNIYEKVATFFDVGIEHKDFELLPQKPDVVILDYPNSTLIRSATCLNIPTTLL